MTEYRDYPLAPVFLDGRGNVFHDSDIRPREVVSRPHSSPHPRCRSPQNRDPVDQSGKYNSGVPMLSNSNLARQSARRKEKQALRDAAVSDDLATFEMNNFHYVTKNKLALLNPLLASGSAQTQSHSSLEFVRSNPAPIKIYDEDDEPYERTATAFAAGSSSLTFAYSARPSTESRPLTGIAVEFLPEDWKFAEFAEIKKDLDGRDTLVHQTGRSQGTRPNTSPGKSSGNGNPLKTTSAVPSAAARGQSAGHSAPLVPDLNSRVLETFRGIGVYTRNNAEHEASLKLLETLMSRSEAEPAPAPNQGAALGGNKSHSNIVAPSGGATQQKQQKGKLRLYPAKTRKAKSPYEHPLLLPVTPAVLPQFKSSTPKQ